MSAASSSAHSTGNVRVNLEHSTVLLVDDNPKSLDMLSSIFHGFGVREQIKCESADAEAAEIVKRRAVDLILVDCSMPEMDGYDFTRWLRRETPVPTRYTPVIMLTGHAAQSKRAQEPGLRRQLRGRQAPDPGRAVAPDPVAGRR
jgi:CheY-like chemotaxis protein